MKIWPTPLFCHVCIVKNWQPFQNLIGQPIRHQLWQLDKSPFLFSGQHLYQLPRLLESNGMKNSTNYIAKPKQ